MRERLRVFRTGLKVKTDVLDSMDAGVHEPRAKVHAMSRSQYSPNGCLILGFFLKPNVFLK